MFSKGFNLDFMGFEELLASDPAKADLFYNQFCDRVFHARHVGISSQELQSWEGQGFFPYKYKETGWRKFSFLEYIWLKCIKKLQSMDVSHKKILFLKEFFFTMEREELIRMIQLTPLMKGIGMKKYLVMAKLELDEDYYNEAKDIIYEKQFSRFSLMVFWILITKANICLLVDEKGKCSYIVLGPYGLDNMINNEVSFNDIQHTSFVLLNLRSIVLDFFEDEKLAFPDEYLISFLTAGQKKVLEKIQEGGLSSITIRFNDGGEPTYIELTKSEISNEVLNKIARYLSRKNFKDIQFKVRGGEVIMYEEKDIIKL